MSFEDEEKFYLDEKTKFVALLNSLGWSEDNLLNQVDKCVGERQTKAAERRGPSLFETVQAIIGSGAEGIELAHPTTNIEQFPSRSTKRRHRSSSSSSKVRKSKKTKKKHHHHSKKKKKKKQKT